MVKISNDRRSGERRSARLERRAPRGARDGYSRLGWEPAGKPAHINSK
jgi:hypothetical protein